MKEILQQYSLYNISANQKMVDALLQLPFETRQKRIVSSFETLQLTLLHIWRAESMWWQRLKLVEVVVFNGDENTTMQEIATGLIGQSRQWAEWIEKSTTAAFEHEFIYRNTKKEQYRQPVFQVLIHLFNHGTYHRGQLITMLRQAGVETVPNTDFIEWSRSKK